MKKQNRHMWRLYFSAFELLARRLTARRPPIVSCPELQIIQAGIMC